MSETLPNGWAMATIPQVAIINPKSALEDVLEIGFTPMSLVPVNFSDKIQFEKRKWKDVKKGYTHFRNNDVIFAKITPCFENSKAALVSSLPNSNGAGSTEYYVLRTITIPPSLLFYWIKSSNFMQHGESKMTGSVGQKRIPKTFVENHPFPIPPLNEQKRIVAKLDKIMPRIDLVKTRLDRVPIIIKRFRQSVLTAAVTGKLTEKWREEHPDVESAEVLIKKKHEIISAFAERYPSSWVHVNAKHICKHITKGTTPKNNGFIEAGIPFLKVYNIVGNKIDFEYKPQYISEEMHNNFLKRARVYPGDVLMNIVGPPLGKVAMVPNTYSEWNVNQAIALFRTLDMCYNKYLYNILIEGYCIKTILIETRGVVGQSNLSLEQCRNLAIPLPPLEEQKEIVRQVDKLFALADKMESHYRKAKTCVDKLSQSLLAKAFRGELVPQDPNDEPAEKLLERIIAEKAKMEGGKKKAGGRKKEIK